jgi:homoserine/homoserine lactone efflux protein
MTMSLWLSFVLVSLAATFSPGPGVLLAISTTLSLGARRTAYSSAGNAIGVFLVSCVAVSGVGLLFAHSPRAFGALKLAGAGYLIYLGVKQWRAAAGAGALELATPAADGSRRALVLRGIAVACSNPKAILFFSAIFPQFMPLEQRAVGRFFLLSMTFVVCTFVSHFSYVVLAASAGPTLFEGRGMVRLKRGMGLIFIVLGVAMLAM